MYEFLDLKTKKNVVESKELHIIWLKWRNIEKQNKDKMLGDSTKQHNETGL